jgi:hypothetical protein
MSKWAFGCSPQPERDSKVCVRRAATEAAEAVANIPRNQHRTHRRICGDPRSPHMKGGSGDLGPVESVRGLKTWEWQTQLER